MRFSTCGDSSGFNSAFNSTMDTATTYCASSRAESVHSKYLNISVDHEGYEIPIPGCSGACGLSHSFDQQCRPRQSDIDHQNGQMFSALVNTRRNNGSRLHCTKSINGSPPPTYSQLFLSSSAGTGNESPESCQGSPGAISEVNSITDQISAETSNQTGSTESLDEGSEMTSVTTALLKPGLTNQYPVHIYRNLSDLMYVNDLASLLETMPLPLPALIPSSSKPKPMINAVSNANYDELFSREKPNVDTIFTNLYTNWKPQSISPEPFSTTNNVVTELQTNPLQPPKEKVPMCSSGPTVSSQVESVEKERENEEKLEPIDHLVVKNYSFDET